MRAEQEVGGDVGGGEGVPVVDDAGLDDEADALEVGGELAEVADAVGTELEVTDAGVVTVGVPATVGAGLEHAPSRPATPHSASTVAAAGSAGRPVGRSLWLTVRA
ncbi:hypothetical protein [Humibacillus sp. DSM 29435]|uniref:hypothetical protein n=1 Tax=Humibacillus sp. DSM 29435 TaxID=1869167 RepID=UPI0020C7EC12|nr:hypothetical protein [Humibacillus sp. DSM 29435]